LPILFRQISSCILFLYKNIRFFIPFSINITIYYNLFLQGVIHILHTVFHTSISLTFQWIHLFFPFSVNLCIAYYTILGFPKIIYITHIQKSDSPPSRQFFYFSNNLTEVIPMVPQKSKRRLNISLLFSYSAISRVA
jgi:hypothetical protein